MNTPKDPVGVASPMEGVVYPPPDRLRQYVAEGALPRQSLAAAYASSFQRYADRLAITGPLGSMSYAQLDENSDRLAAAMKGVGAQPQDRAIFQLSNAPELIVAVMGCLKIGVIPICTLVNHREHEIGSLGRLAAARFWFVQGGQGKHDLCEFAERLKPLVPSIEHVIVAGTAGRVGQHLMQDLIEGQSASEAQAVSRKATAQLDPFQVAVFQLSGGTTGISKIVPRFSNDYLCNMLEGSRVVGRRAPELVFCGGPFLHNAGFAVHWGPSLLIGGTVLIGDDLSQEGLFSLFTQYKPTRAFLPKPLLLRLVAGMEQNCQRITSLKTIVTTAQASLVRKEFGARPINVYGMAEGIAMLPPGSEDNLRIPDGGCGLPISPMDEVRLVHPDTLDDVADGEVGELLARGPYTLHGYYKADDRNRAAFTADGFLRTGDLMRKVVIGNEMGYVFEGRFKDIVKRAGESIICDEV
jgi:2,3-dihydroxybenzoate-AMP ligase